MIGVKPEKVGSLPALALSVSRSLSLSLSLSLGSCVGTRSLEGGSHKKRGENSGREKEKRGPNFDRETERVRSPSSWLSLSPLRGTLESFDSGQASFPRGAKGLLFSRLILGPIMAQKLLARFS